MPRMKHPFARATPKQEDYIDRLIEQSEYRHRTDAMREALGRVPISGLNRKRASDLIDFLREKVSPWAVVPGNLRPRDAKTDGSVATFTAPGPVDVDELRGRGGTTRVQPMKCHETGDWTFFLHEGAYRYRRPNKHNQFLLSDGVTSRDATIDEVRRWMFGGKT